MPRYENLLKQGTEKKSDKRSPVFTPASEHNSDKRDLRELSSLPIKKAHSDEVVSIQPATEGMMNDIREFISYGIYQQYMINPSEKCYDACMALSEDLKEKGYLVKGGEFILADSPTDNMPCDHYFIIAIKDCQNVVIDITAGQFDRGAERVILAPSLEAYIEEFITLPKLRRIKIWMKTYSSVRNIPKERNKFISAQQVAMQNKHQEVYTPPGFEKFRSKYGAPDTKNKIPDEVLKAYLGKDKSKFYKFTAWYKGVLTNPTSSLTGQESWNALLKMEASGLLTASQIKKRRAGLSAKNYAPLFKDSYVTLNDSSELSDLPVGLHLGLIEVDDNGNRGEMKHALVKSVGYEAISPDVRFFDNERAGPSEVNLSNYFKYVPSLGMVYQINGRNHILIGEKPQEKKRWWQELLHRSK